MVSRGPQEADASAGGEAFVEAKTSRQGLVVAAKRIFRGKREVGEAAISDWHGLATVRAGGEEKPLTA
jgi:hypothetical protein